MSRLPPEVLSRIFMALALNERPNEARLWKSDNEEEDTDDSADQDKHKKSDDMGNPNLGWMKVLLVCKRWRDVALADQGVWSDMEFAFGEDWVSNAFAHAPSSPLAITCFSIDNVPIERMTPHASLVAAHLSHTQVLEFTDSHDEACAIVVSALSKSAHLLQKLEILVPEDCVYGETPFVGTDIPEDFLGGDAPNLRYLKVDFPAVFPWESPVLRNLVSLTVGTEGQPDANPHPPSLNKFLDVLEGMTALEHLTLNHSPWRATGRAHGTVNLARLSDMSVGGMIAPYTPFLARLQLPASAKILFGFRDYNVPSFRAFCSALASAVSNRTIAEVVCIPGVRTVFTIALQPPRDAALPETTDPWTWYCRNGRRSMAPIVRIDFNELTEDTWPRMGEMSRVVCAQFVREHTEALSMYSETGSFTAWEPETWMEVLERAPRLHTLVTSDPLGTQLIFALVMMPHLVPALQRLAFYMVDFMESSIPIGNEPAFLLFLKDMLRKRRAAGREISVLSMQRCVMRDVDPLRALVGEFKWDGNEEGYSIG